ncbi:hypothetical protein DYB37_001907 [Aphanomyces astaci]|uniref:Uncharacterized protein n=2 Tax=Aphanomyces astaci TaxID=112090 RepID=A0A418EVK4_APHAT|nr:hypothetical protein DYB37_001907 [Aphanomyces astaci]
MSLGGISDARHVRAALALGADAVQVGTAFMGTPESGAPAVWKAALGPQANSQSTTVTRGLTGRPARMFRNALVEVLQPYEELAASSPRQRHRMRDIFQRKQAQYMALLAAGGTAAAATTNPFLAAVELHFPLLLRHVINLNPLRTDSPPSSIKFLVCVPQSLSLLTSDVTLADLYSHVLVADAAVGQYQTLDGTALYTSVLFILVTSPSHPFLAGTYVAIAGSYLLTKPGLDSHPGRTVRIIMTDAYSHPAMTPPDAYQVMHLHIRTSMYHPKLQLTSRGVAVPEDMGEMDRATFRRYIAMIRAYPESAPVFSSIDVFVQDLLSSRKPPRTYMMHMIHPCYCEHEESAYEDLYNEQLPYTSND